MEARQNITETARGPQPGDVISARYRWTGEPDNEPGKKIRPCLILKVLGDGASIIVAPISSHADWLAKDCVEIPPDEKPEAGLDSYCRSWVKLSEVNRFDLPNLAIVPHVDPEGQMSWRRGRVSEDVLQRVQSEIGHRIHDRSLKGNHVKSDGPIRVRMSTIRRMPGDPASRQDRLSDIQDRAAALAARTEAPTPARQADQSR